MQLPNFLLVFFQFVGFALAQAREGFTRTLKAIGDHPMCILTVAASFGFGGLLGALLRTRSHANGTVGCPPVSTAYSTTTVTTLVTAKGPSASLSAANLSSLSMNGPFSFSLSGTSTIWANSITPGTTFASTTLEVTTISLMPVPHLSSDDTSTATKALSHSNGNTMPFVTETDTQTVEYGTPSASGNGLTHTTTVIHSTLETIFISSGTKFSTSATYEESDHGPTWTPSPFPTSASSMATGTASVMSNPTSVTSSKSTSTEFVTSTLFVSSVKSKPPFTNDSSTGTTKTYPFKSYASADLTSSTKTPNSLTSTKVPWRSFSTILSTSPVSAAAQSSSSGTADTTFYTSSLSSSMSKIPWSSFTTTLSQSSTESSIPWESFTTTLFQSSTASGSQSGGATNTSSIPWESFTTTLSQSSSASHSQTNVSSIPWESFTTTLSQNSTASTLPSGGTTNKSCTDIALTPASAEATESSSISGSGPTLPSEGPSVTSHASSVLSSATSKLSSSVSSSLSAIDSSLPPETATPSPYSANVTAMRTSTTSVTRSTDSVTPEPPPKSSASLPTGCGPVGSFVINFDDLPAGPSPTSNSSTADPLDNEDEPSIFSPFHDLFFSYGFYYVPPPKDPFKPSSPPQLAVFLPNKTGQPLDHPDIGTLYSGEIGAGPESASDAFAFNAYSARLGCDWAGNCSMGIYGYRYDEATGNQTQVVSQFVELPPCNGTGCELWLTSFGPNFTNITGIRFEAYNKDLEPLKWFMDDFSLGWSNNTCAAAQQRENVRSSEA